MNNDLIFREIKKIKVKKNSRKGRLNCHPGRREGVSATGIARNKRGSNINEDANTSGK